MVMVMMMTRQFNKMCTAITTVFTDIRRDIDDINIKYECNLSIILPCRTAEATTIIGDSTDLKTLIETAYNNCIIPQSLAYTLRIILSGRDDADVEYESVTTELEMMAALYGIQDVTTRETTIDEYNDGYSHALSIILRSNSSISNDEACGVMVTMLVPMGYPNDVILARISSSNGLFVSDIHQIMNILESEYGCARTVCHVELDNGDLRIFKIVNFIANYLDNCDNYSSDNYDAIPYMPKSFNDMYVMSMMTMTSPADPSVTLPPKRCNYRMF